MQKQMEPTRNVGASRKTITKGVCFYASIDDYTSESLITFIKCR